MRSIVPGKLANSTILAENPVTSPASRIKDITIWGTVQEGRKLPVHHQNDAHAALGRVANDATFKAMEFAQHAREGKSAEGSDVCILNRLFAAALGSTGKVGTEGR